MSYTAIRTQLITILEGMTSLAEVYGYEAKALNMYPCATLSMGGHQDSFMDTQANQRIFNFVIRIYVRAEDAANGETSLALALDELITTIEGNITLNGSCDFARPTTARALDGEKETPVRLLEVTVEAVKRVAR